ncbi:FAD-binding oxidoreductase [Wolbachia endosymbiont of Psylliodes chrysocephala]|uniref:FAD-binding oxidoreductase n=1 Tax=Wolbachia endosymbiont of Psylliodes chrysocephala TaxID=2883236 RepID=UPI00209D3916|nr:FAD-binding oxidoreductase [Wolbachia endosymbiont of Psylliodes chrysocephala]
MVDNFAASSNEPLDQGTIEVIKNLLPVLGNDGTMGKIVETFYNILLTKERPEFKNIFNASNQLSGRQATALSKALLQFFSNIEIDKKQTIKMFEPVMIKHVSLGVKGTYYQAVGKCLVDAIREVVPETSEEQIVAIEEAYSYLSKVFIEEEAKIYKKIEDEELGGWKGEREFTITKIVNESKDGKIKSFGLRPKDGKKILAFEAGDHISISVASQLRQYSLSNYTKGAGLLEYRITVKKEKGGNVSTCLHELKEGDIVKIRPPVGIFHLKEEHIKRKLPIVLLSSGNGLTPVLSMLHKLVKEEYKGKVYYIHCTQNRMTHAMEEEVEKIANKNIKVVNFYSQESEEFEEQKVSSKAKHIMQRINQESLRKVLEVEKIGDYRFYCCGSERWFIGQEKESGVKTLLVNIGVKEDQIFTESFGPSFAIATAVSGEPCFDSGSGKGNSVDKKSSKKAIQSIVAGIVGAVLLASGVTLYIMKMPVVAAVVGIAGLACIGFSLYNALKPGTKLEKVEDVEVCRRDAKDVYIEQASAKATQ